MDCLRIGLIFMNIHEYPCRPLLLNVHMQAKLERNNVYITVLDHITYLTNQLKLKLFIARSSVYNYRPLRVYEEHTASSNYSFI